MWFFKACSHLKILISVVSDTLISQICEISHIVQWWRNNICLFLILKLELKKIMFYVNMYILWNWFISSLVLVGSCWYCENTVEFRCWSNYPEQPRGNSLWLSSVPEHDISLCWWTFKMFCQIWVSLLIQVSFFFLF